MTWPSGVWELGLSHRKHFTSNQWLWKNKTGRTIAWTWVLKGESSSHISAPLQTIKGDPRWKKPEVTKLSLRAESTMRSQRKLEISPRVLSNIITRSKPSIVIDAALVPGFGPGDTLKWWLFWRIIIECAFSGKFHWNANLIHISVNLKHKPGGACKAIETKVD